VGAAIVLVVAALVVSVLITALSPVGATTVLAPAGGPTGLTSAPTVAPAPAVADETTSVPLLVHVLGAVTRPGVYELAGDARVVDVIALAGGFTDAADRSSVNLARPLADGEQLRVLAIGETPPQAPAPPPGAGAPSSPDTAPGASSPASKLDLNTATALELEELPRIGPAMATRIVEWRDTNGPFASVDDLLQITGIGDKTFESLRDLVTV
jgi:competence protein ComEA